MKGYNIFRYINERLQMKEDNIYRFSFIWCVVILYIGILTYMGCLLKKPLVKAQVAEEIKVADTVKAADKITGVESLKVADKAEAENVMGSGKIEKNQTSTSVGGNMTNDSEVIKQYINASKEAESNRAKAEDETKSLLKYVIIGLLLLISKYELQIRSINKRLFKIMEKDEAEEEARMTKLLNKVMK